MILEVGNSSLSDLGKWYGDFEYPVQTQDLSSLSVMRVSDFCLIPICSLDIMCAHQLVKEGTVSVIVKCWSDLSY